MQVPFSALHYKQPHPLPPAQTPHPVSFLYEEILEILINKNTKGYDLRGIKYNRN